MQTVNSILNNFKCYDAKESKNTLKFEKQAVSVENSEESEVK